MSTAVACTPRTTHSQLANDLRSFLHQVDLIGMVAAETYDARRNHLPHHRDVACLIDAEAEGCEGLCFEAILAVIDDTVGFYRRQLDRGDIGTLDNPGGYARCIIQRRHLDVVRSFTIPTGGYSRPERLADAKTRPAYLGLRDDIDGRIVAATTQFLRSGTQPVTWTALCEHAETACLRRGLAIAPGEARTRLDHLIDTSQADNGRRGEFFRREILDPYPRRQTHMTGMPHLSESTSLTVAHPGDIDQNHVDALALTDLLERIDAHLDAHGGWDYADRDARRAAIEHELPAATVPTRDIIALISEVRQSTP